MMNANDNFNPEVPAGDSYYPEMGQKPNREAIIEASLSHYGRHEYLTFAATNRERVMVAIAAAKVRFNGLDEWQSTKGETKVTLRMTCAAYEKFRALNRNLCTSAILL